MILLNEKIKIDLLFCFILSLFLIITNIEVKAFGNIFSSIVDENMKTKSDLNSLNQAVALMGKKNYQKYINYSLIQSIYLNPLVLNRKLEDKGLHFLNSSLLDLGKKISLFGGTKSLTWPYFLLQQDSWHFTMKNSNIDNNRMIEVLEKNIFFLKTLSYEEVEKYWDERKQESVRKFLLYSKFFQHQRELEKEADPSFLIEEMEVFKEPLAMQEKNEKKKASFLDIIEDHIDSSLERNEEKLRVDASKVTQEKIWMPK